MRIRIRDPESFWPRIWDPKWEKILTQDKHPGSATLPGTYITFNPWSFISFNTCDNVVWVKAVFGPFLNHPDWKVYWWTDVWRDAGDLSAEEMARNAARLPPVLSTVLPSWTPDKEKDISCKQTKNFVKLWNDLWMRSSLMVRASDCQCRSRNSPGFDSSILRHSWVWGAAEESTVEYST